MRVMVIVKASRASEAGLMPDAAMLEAMGKFNEELVNAGVMLAGEGLHPTSRGVRVRFAGDQRHISEGPFPNPEEQIAGFWLWKVDSLDEAVAWIQRAPFNSEAVELRPVFEAEDFGAAFTPELRAREESQRARAEEIARGMPH